MWVGGWVGMCMRACVHVQNRSEKHTEEFSLKLSSI